MSTLLGSGYVLGASGGRDQPLTAQHKQWLDELIAERGRPGMGMEGGAPGIDEGFHAWLKAKGIPPVTFAAAWRREDGSTDKGAGHRRNGFMACFAILHASVTKRKAVWVLFPGGRGTQNMFEALTEVKAAGNHIEILDWRNR